jgi:very-short-patch-repair endonuclease
MGGMGVHRREDLLADGTGRRVLARMHRVLPSIYSTESPSYQDRCRAVALWKPDAVISHHSAAWLWGLLDVEPSTVEATVPLTSNVRGPEWLTLHRRPPGVVTSWRGMPIVTVERSLFDVALTLPAAALDRLFDAAIDTVVDWRVVAALCADSPRMHGVVAVRRQLRTCCPRTRSEVERMVARGLSERRMPLEINARVGKYYGDLVCRRGRVVVEIDGREFHIGAAVFTSDRIRQNDLIDDDWRVVRYSAATVSLHLDEVVEDIIRIVRARRRARRA